MVPKSEKLVLALLAKEKMSMFEKSGSKRYVGAELCTVTSQGNSTTENKNVNVPAGEAENPDIDVTDGVNLGGGYNGDTTNEPSGSLSSFGDTVSGGDGDLGMSDGEITSEFCGSGQTAWGYPGFEDAFRISKKKITNHWRNFIRPIMWRCKWAELQMKKLQIQASVYSKILKQFEQARQTQKENFNVEAQCSRSLPFPHQLKRRRIMRRHKRKRIEDTADVSSYVHQHNLFAFCENKGTSTDLSHLTNEYANPVIHAVRNNGTCVVDNGALVHFDDEDTCFERILANIYSMQSQVHHLTTRMDKVISRKHERFSSLDKLNLVTTPNNSGASTEQDSAPSVSDKHEVLVTSPIMLSEPASDYHIHKGNIPVTLVTDDQVADSLPSMIETVNQPVVADESDNAEDESLLKKHPNPDTRELKVYRRGKKHKMYMEMQPNGNSSTSRNEKSRVFLASRYTSLLNNQKKRGKRIGRGTDSGKKTSGDS